MNLSIGIIGLPNVGKSTIFNALTEKGAEASNYPFCTIDPNVGIVEVPDERLKKIETVIATTKVVPAAVEFIDIAGIVKGAAKGEGLGNKFLANIRQCHAICEVVRIFTDKNISHVTGDINPQTDMETVKIELILKDMETVEKRLSKLKKDIKGNPKLKDKLTTVEKIQENLEKGKTVRGIDLSKKEKEIIKDMSLLTLKPHIYIFNVDEEHLLNKVGIEKIIDENNIIDYVIISAKIESELNELDNNEKKEYLEELGQTNSGLNQLIKKGYDILGLQTFFTAGEKEIKAWTIKRGIKAPEAAGTIHGDFERGFIKAETIDWKSLVECGGWQKAKERGKVRLEGKDYIVQDGDTMIFKFNV